ncbi:MAG: chlorohydrolase [Desulfotalea sp.]|nr:MAG: chlorohydrolase [Desulfotalea sp.]
MKILKASWLLCLDNNSTIIENGAIVYDNKIVDVGQVAHIKKKYPDITIEDCGENTVLMPGLINSHVHLEFSANRTTLKYGNFMAWLHSVMSHRDTLIKRANTTLISARLTEMLHSGTTTIGAISSKGLDMEACLKSPINTVYYTEVIGSDIGALDTSLTDFKARINRAKCNQSPSFIPAIAIHSPYSTHPSLVKLVLNIAREENLSVTAHFMESEEESLWLHNDEGAFLTFFNDFLGQDKAATKPLDFLHQFNNIKHLSFTHCVAASPKELGTIRELGATINHCVTSNRILNNTRLDLTKLIDIDYSIGTDGLSSNNSLSMFDELRNALMMHWSVNINTLAKELLIAATRNGARALGVEKGTLTQGKDADMIVCTLPDSIENAEELYTHIILHTKRATQVIINGVKQV